MKGRKHTGGSRAAELTMQEHLWLEREMQHRAHELWLAGGCRRRSALDHWLQAERETWGRFERIPPVAERKRRGGARSAGHAHDEETRSNHERRLYEHLH